MRFFDRFTKRKMSFDEAGRYLLLMATAGLKPFLEESLPEIADYLDIDLDDFDINVLRGEIMMVSLWAATKALENDDHRLIRAIHSSCFDAIGDEDRRNQFQEAFSHRYEKYNEAWDERSGGNQTVLALYVLSEMFNEGEIDRGLFDIFASTFVIQFVFTTMGNVLKARAKIRLIA
jgi:hypothetical protein